MSESQHLSEGLERFYSSPENGWFTSITSAVSGLNADQATRVPAEGFNSVWAVVNHVRYWQEYMLLRLKGQIVDRQAFNGGMPDWAPPPAAPTEGDWRALLEHCGAVNRELVGYVARLSDEDTNAEVNPGKPRRWQIVQGLAGHTSYHACEIITIRHMLGLWLENA